MSVALAFSTLRDADRRAVVLHFLRKQTFRDVGAALGFSEEAARKRVSRALEALREFLSARGVAYPTSTVAAVIATFAVQSAFGIGCRYGCRGHGERNRRWRTDHSFLNSSARTYGLDQKKTLIVAAVSVAAIPVVIPWQEKKELRREIAALNAALARKAAAPSAALEVPPVPRNAADVEMAQTPPRLPSTRDLIQSAFALTASGKSRAEAVKEIEPLLALIPIAQIAQAANEALKIADRTGAPNFSACC